METIKFTSSQAPNANDYVRAILSRLSAATDLPIEFVEAGDWLARERLLDRGEIHFGWVCGWPYVLKADDPQTAIGLLAAPVMAGDRYLNRPIYFSDVITRPDSPYRGFSDLKGARWAFNERRSHSGYNLTRYALAKLGEKRKFFGEVVEAGSHQRAIRMIVSGEVDASAIDSTVLETELRRNPDLAAQLRTIDVLGPSPIPPWIVHESVPAAIRAALRAALLDLENDDQGRQLLSRGALRRFSAVEDRDYDPIREMARMADEAEL